MMPTFNILLESYGNVTGQANTVDFNGSNYG